MPFPVQSRNRTHLLCPFCKLTQFSLSVHLAQKCMKDSPLGNRKNVLEAAKKEAHELLQRGRVIDYGLIGRIMDSPRPVESLIQELGKRGIIVVNIPPALPVLTQDTTQHAAPSAAVSEPTACLLSESSESFREHYQGSQSVGRKTSLREKMSRSGLYNKHSSDHPLLKGFAHYLEADLANEKFTQEVDNISRFMYFIDHRQPSLQFVRHLEQSREYFNTLSEVGLSKQTIQNYIKSIKRFLKYQISSTDLSSSDEQLYNDCQKYINFLSNLQVMTSKPMSKEVIRKRFPMLTEGVISPDESQAVLAAAKKDFLAVIEKLSGPGAVRGHQLSQQESQLVLYYLEAILILSHLQQPGVVEHMTVKEWLLRQRVEGKGHVIVEHKTAATQVAAFALNQEEEMWFDTYFTEIRPTVLSKKKKVEVEGDEPEETFFLSSTGDQIYNASNDMERLHKKYNLRRVTSQMARRAHETATQHMSDTEKSMVADYGLVSAEQQYRLRDVLSASLLLRSLRSNPDKEREPSAFAGSSRMSEQAAYDLLVKSYPVTVDGVPPKRSVRLLLTGKHQRSCYDHWRDEQMHLRMQHVQDHFGRRQPTVSRVRSWIEKQGWSANQPDAALVVKQWNPSGRVDTALNSAAIQKMVRTQRWKGLAVLPVEGKGRGVIATRPFQIGEAVCDYHGKVVSRLEGIETHQSTVGCESGYMFFYKNKNGQSMCIDAHSEECECHPGIVIIGRLINHSSKRANVGPKCYSLDGRDIILFIAITKIEVNTEILFDYGVNRKSFAGEGLDLDWL